MGAETSFSPRKFCTGREKRATPEGELDETGERHSERRERGREDVQEGIESTEGLDSGSSTFGLETYNLALL